MPTEQKAAAERTTIKIKGPRHIRTVWELYGMARVLEAIENEPHGKLPGFGLAKAIAEREVADTRARLAGDSLREVARAGYDVGIHNVYTTVNKQGEAVLEIEAIDLAEMAEVL